ncbi:hypothetical protein LZZ85_16960 [Terrimonas sp. NA20]|uniref:Uncharacterized protein n=1 Tax=Terrimonas ginsenosidimutans TaxID=2908004 RepID=A0ABS9KUL0_9BACT|nr:hypothetical protein [Terrimonas ginsenosidimutans]MCG2615990.1 hypothetical protein [Terrimonas ginsenosidimutans]
MKMHIGKEADWDTMLQERVSELKERNYILKFRREPGCLYCFELSQWLQPAEFSIDEAYLFDEAGSPDAARMIYAISLAGGLKGVLVDTCDVYADNMSMQMVYKLKSERLMTNTGRVVTYERNHKPLELGKHIF